MLFTWLPRFERINLSHYCGKQTARNKTTVCCNVLLTNTHSRSLSLSLSQTHTHTHTQTHTHIHIPARLHNMATNYIKQCLCLLFLSHGKFVPKLAFFCIFSEAEPQNCHVSCKNKKWKLHKFTPQTFYIYAHYGQHKIWLHFVHPDRAVSKCLSVSSTGWRCSLWTLLNACLSKPSPKCYT
jgi:hypothetical protein